MSEAQRVLIVDDDPVAVEMMKESLEPFGVEILAASDWPAASPILVDTPVSVVLLDIGLTGIQGDSIARIIQTCISPQPKIVLVSSMEPAKLERLCRQVDAFNFLPKGCSLAHIHTVVDSALKAHARERGE